MSGETEARGRRSPAGRPAAPAGAPQRGLSAAAAQGWQKKFIIENAGILNRETKRAILAIVMMEIGPSVLVDTGGAPEVDIDLDAVTRVNDEVLAHIYNIVQTRRDSLSQPAGKPAARPAVPAA